MSNETPTFTIVDAASVTNRTVALPSAAIGAGDCISKSPKDTSSGRLKKRRKSRATNKAPLRVFPADVSNFMVMVHKLTGISSHSSHSFDTRSTMLFPSTQGLPTLDTSSALLSRWPHDYVSNIQGVKSFNASSTQQQSGITNLAPGYHQLANNAGTTCASLPSLWEAADSRQRTQDGNYLNGNEPAPRKEKVSYGSKTEADILGSGENSMNENLFSGYDVPIEPWLYGTAELVSKEEFE